MQKWEYCEISGLRAGGLRYTEFVKLSAKGRQVVTAVNLSQTNDADKHREAQDTFACIIAQLGEEGWEMVGAGNISEGQHTLYFKRPK